MLSYTFRQKGSLWTAGAFFWLMMLLNEYAHHHHHQSLNREGRWGTTDDFATSFLHFFPVLHCPLGLPELQACPFPDVVFPPLPLPALSSSPFHSTLQDGFGQTWWTGVMTIPLQFPSLYDRQKIFSFRLFTIVRRCGPVACWILARTTSLVTWSLYEMCVILT